MISNLSTILTLSSVLTISLICEEPIETTITTTTQSPLITPQMPEPELSTNTDAISAPTPSTQINPHEQELPKDFTSQDAKVDLETKLDSQMKITSDVEKPQAEPVVIAEVNTQSSQEITSSPIDMLTTEELAIFEKLSPAEQEAFIELMNEALTMDTEMCEEAAINLETQASPKVLSEVQHNIS